MLDMDLYLSQYILCASHEIRGPDNILVLVCAYKNEICIKSTFNKMLLYYYFYFKDSFNFYIEDLFFLKLHMVLLNANTSRPY